MIPMILDPRSDHDEVVEKSNFLPPVITSVVCAVLQAVIGVVSAGWGIVALVVLGIVQTLVWTSNMRYPLAALWISAFAWAALGVTFMMVWHSMAG